MSAARHVYGLPAVGVADERPRVPSGVLALLLLVAVLAAATVWFVALPVFEAAPAKRSCEVIVLQSGTTKCVEKPTLGSQATSKTSKRPSGAKS